MARFEMEIPNDIIKQMEQVSNDCEKIFGEMTKAGAEVVYKNIKASVPKGIRDSEMMDCLKVTDVYKTPSDDGINTKVAFYGYFTNDNGVKTPAPLVANVFEYGRSNAPQFQKHPFMRKSFKKKQIEEAMLKAQKEASGGLLDDDE